MARFDAAERLYKLVDDSASDSLDYVVPDGQALLIVNMGLSSSSSPESVGCIVWDPEGTPEILMSSYHEAMHRDAEITVTGDGTKVIRIHLANDLTEPAYLGGFWQGVFL